jgi:hypothetical protein
MDIGGGDKFAEALRSRGNSAGRARTVRVGFLKGATYPDGTSVALVAAINEFGAPSRGQPPRPFFRNMIAEKQAEWPKAIAALLKANDFDAERTLDLVGQAIVGQLQESIQKLVDPPLKPSTIARKGFSKPLIDHGVMIRSVSHEVDRA